MMRGSQNPPGGRTPEQIAARFLAMRVVHVALLMGVVLFGAIVIVIRHGSIALSPSVRDPRCVAAAVLCAATLFASSVIRPGRAGGGVPLGIATALQRYQVFWLIRAALIEGGALFSAVVTLITSNILPAILFVVSAAALAFHRPTREEFDSLFPAGRT